MSCLVTLLLCEGCTYYCSVKLVAVIGDSGLCLFCWWVWSEGGLMFYSNCRCRKGSFCHRSARRQSNGLLQLSMSLLPLSFLLSHSNIFLPHTPSLSTLLCFSLASVSPFSHILSLSFSFFVSLSLIIIICKHPYYAMFRLHLATSTTTSDCFCSLS